MLNIADEIFNIKEQLPSMQIEIETPPALAVDKFPFQLPQLKIPRFKNNDNDPCDYMRFKSLFISCTQDSGMNNKRLFQIFKSFLDGKAASLIGALKEDEKALEIALQLIDKEFLDKE